MIKNSRQLRAELQRLYIKSELQEKSIREDIASFKRKLSISGFVISLVTGVAAAAIGRTVTTGAVGGVDSLMKSGVMSGISLLLKKYFNVAEQKIEDFVRQIINKVFDAMKELKEEKEEEVSMKDTTTKNPEKHNEMNT